MMDNTIQITLGIALGKGSAKLCKNANLAKNQRIPCSDCGQRLYLDRKAVDKDRWAQIGFINQARCALRFFRMMNQRIGDWSSALVLFTMLSTGAVAQEQAFGKAAVSATANQEVNLIPEKIRMQVAVKAESREAENALKLLQQHFERITKQLTQLNAESSSIELSKPILTLSTLGMDDPESAKRRVRQQNAMQGRMNRPSLPTETEIDQLPQIFTAASILVAEWKLENGLTNEAILLTSTLRLAIDEHDFKGKKLRETPEPEEQAILQSIVGADYFPNNNRMPDVQILYVAKMTEAQEEEAITTAFKKTQSQAAMLAKATGRKLGNLRSVSSNFNPMMPTYTSAYSNLNGISSALSRRNLNEAINEDPNGLKLLMTVSAAFEIE